MLLFVIILKVIIKTLYHTINIIIYMINETLYSSMFQKNDIDE